VRRYGRRWDHFPEHPLTLTETASLLLGVLAENWFGLSFGLALWTAVATCVTWLGTHLAKVEGSSPGRSVLVAASGVVVATATMLTVVLFSSGALRNLGWLAAFTLPGVALWRIYRLSAWRALQCWVYAVLGQIAGLTCWGFVLLKVLA